MTWRIIIYYIYIYIGTCVSLFVEGCLLNPETTSKKSGTICKTRKNMEKLFGTTSSNSGTICKTPTTKMQDLRGNQWTHSHNLTGIEWNQEIPCRNEIRELKGGCPIDSCGLANWLVNLGIKRPQKQLRKFKGFSGSFCWRWNVSLVFLLAIFKTWTYCTAPIFSHCVLWGRKSCQ